MPTSAPTSPGARPRLVHAATAVVVVLIGAVTAGIARATVVGSIFYGEYPEDAVQLWTVPTVWFAGASVGAAVLTFRRSRPVVVVGVLTVLGVLSLVTAGVLGVLGACVAIAVYSLASTWSAPTTWITVVVVFVVLTAASWRWQDIGVAEMLFAQPTPADSGPIYDLTEPDFSSGRRTASAVLLLVLLLLAVAAGSGVRARRLAAQAIVERHEAALRDSEASAALGRASERARIAREMHDIVAHSVSVMIALSDGAAAAFDRAPDRSREALHELSRTGRSALADMQRVLGALDPDEEGTRTEPMEPTGTDLQTIVDRFRTAGLPLTATGLDVAVPLDTSLRLTLVRIVSEALTNALRHATGARSVQVSVRRSAAEVVVEVLDDAPSDDVPDAGSSPGSGRGLTGMRERAALLGGHVHAGPRVGGGWRVLLVLPCDGEAGR